MQSILPIALGGAIGAVMRFTLSKVIQNRVGGDFPWGTLTVNLLGALIIGFIISYLGSKMALSPTVKALLITGMLGGFTTFSSFSFESTALLFRGELNKFILYISLTNIVGIAMTIIGYQLGSLIGR